jgi:hypothetical protein
MLIGRNLLQNQKIAYKDISHRNIKTLLDAFEAQQVEQHQQATAEIKKALLACYGDRPISLQQLSATFRRGDLLEMLSI